MPEGPRRARLAPAAPPSPLAALAANHVGEPAEAVDVSWDHGESAVWRVSGPLGTVALKAHSQSRKFVQEVTAYQEWLPLLGAEVRAEGTRSPRLLACREEHPRGVVLSWERGVVVEAAGLGGREETVLHERAGGFLRALHELPVEDPDTVPLDEAYALRLSEWEGRAVGVVPSTLLVDVRDAVSEALPLLGAQRRVPCHRDYTPRNWLAGEDGELVVIDFEHARHDARLTDLQRLWTGLWRSRSELREAFLAGYGRELDEDEEGMLRRLSALWALSTVVWAREHRDAAFEAHGWDALRWLGLADDRSSAC